MRFPFKIILVLKVANIEKTCFSNDPLNDICHSNDWSLHKTALACKEPTSWNYPQFADEKTEVREGQLVSPVDPECLPETVALTSGYKEISRASGDAAGPLWPAQPLADPPRPAPPLSHPTHNVHECEQVLLHMLLPVELHHGVVHAQQDLDVVVVVCSMPACPPPRAVDMLLQDAQGAAEAVQVAQGGPCKERTPSSAAGQTHPATPPPTRRQLTSSAILSFETHSTPNPGYCSILQRKVRCRGRRQTLAKLSQMQQGSDRHLCDFQDRSFPSPWWQPQPQQGPQWPPHDGQAC